MSYLFICMYTARPLDGFAVKAHIPISKRILPSAHRTCVLDKPNIKMTLREQLSGPFFVVVAKTVYQHARVSDKTIIVYGATRFNRRPPAA